jgi:hypothetical protein
VAIVTTAGAANANSYTDVAGFRAYCLGRLHTDLADNANDTDIEKALRMAARWFEQLNWKGRKTSSTQALAHPRTGMTDRLGDDIDGATIYLPVISAQCEAALVLLERDVFKETGMEGFEQLSMGSKNFVPNHRPSNALPAAISAILYDVLGAGGNNQVRLVRG